MGIRTYNKNHLKDRPERLAETDSLGNENGRDNALCFWTVHPTSPVLVDLNVFKQGETQRSRSGSSYNGGFTGRPALIDEIAPYFRSLVEHTAARTVTQYLCSLRAWWRIFDSIEVKAASIGIVTQRVTDITHISEIHRQSAIDDNMPHSSFHPFVAVLELARKVKGHKALHWRAPRKKDPIRHLPPKWQIDQLRFALKHGWFDALHRWERADELINDAVARDGEECRLKKNYKRFVEVAHATGRPRPAMEHLHGSDSPYFFLEAGYKITDMLRGIYPDGTDVKMAFNLCLANTGWNPSVLLNLDVSGTYIEPHPKDPARYIMRAYKARGQSEQVTEGLYKSSGSAGMIIKKLVDRTAPLRAELRREMTELEQRLPELLRSPEGNSALINETKSRIFFLRKGVLSPWIFVTSATTEIKWLHSANYNRSKRNGELSSFIEDLTIGINKRLPPDRQISTIKPSDFRDAFAAYAYQLSGGLIMYVMRALGHRSPTTTQAYLDNSLLNNESTRLYRMFSDSLWKEIETFGRVDPSIIAKWARDGTVSDSDRQRLQNYRSLRKSRLGIGCKDPHNPPIRIAPNFVSNGKAMCPVQRCTLCVEHAVIFPESIDGLCKRLAELLYIKSRMPVSAFVASNFGDEIRNTELALKHFDAADVDSRFKSWQKNISEGNHFVIEFDGA